MDGIDAARHIRAHAPIPVIYVSASTDAPTVARAWQSAPVGYLVKPVSDHALRATLMRVLGDLSRLLRWRKPGADVWPASHRHGLRKA